MKKSTSLHIQNKIDNLCGLWCTLACLYPVKVKACRTKKYAKSFKTKVTTGINLEESVNFKRHP